MYISDVIAYLPAEITVRECNESHTLQFSVGQNITSITMSTDQLLDVAETIEWYLLKKDDPADCFSCRHWEAEHIQTDRGAVPSQFHCKKDSDPEGCKEYEP